MAELGENYPLNIFNHVFKLQKQHAQCRKKSGNKDTGGDDAGGGADSDYYSSIQFACYNSGFLLISTYHF